MMKKVLDFIRSYILAIIPAVIILIVGSIILFSFLSKEEPSLIELDENNYYLSYDSTWKIDTKEKDTVILKHKSGSKVTIQLSKLTDEYSYATMDELIDELIYNIQQQNPNYKLLSKKQDKITKYEFDGYKILYENSKEQVMVHVYKKSDQLVIIRYEAENSYFDILLDSVQTIIYNLDIKDENFNLKNNLKLDIDDIKYSKNKDFDQLLTKSKTYEIARKNYYVEYSIPSNFELKRLDSSSGWFKLEFDEGEIDLYVDIRNRNIYEYLDQEDIGLYNNYKHYKQSEDYSNFKETLTKLESDYDSYIYKNSYYYNKAAHFDKDFNRIEYKRKDENAELIYALNNSHILVIAINARGAPITEKLIQQIKVNTSKNYASYVKVEKEDNFLVGILQRFSDYTRKTVDYITLKVPDKYEEIDKDANIYLERNYALNYHEDTLIYDYEVRYELTKLSPDFITDKINSIYIKTAYGESHNLTYSGDLILNGKNFKVYDGGYTDLSGIMLTKENRQRYYVNKKILFYEMPDDGNLYIEIDGNGKELSEDILNELTNFTVETKDV